MGAITFPHLHPSVRGLAQKDDEERILVMQRDRWIDYSRASEATQRLERLILTPQRERMPCLLLHGPSNIGKTLIVTKFQRAHPPNFDEGRGIEHRQIVSLQMPATPDQHRFYSALLFELGAPHSANARLSVLERLARDLLRRMTPKMLIVDEVHHLLAGSHREQRASLNLLKYLANDLKISVVAVGTSDALIALQTDAQVSSRFTPFEIPRWSETEDFRRLLRAFEQVLPLRSASDLIQRPMVQFLLAASGGLTGEVARLLNDAATLAIRSGRERITLEHLEHVAHEVA